MQFATCNLSQREGGRDRIGRTVGGLGGDRFDVQRVPFTMEHTNLSRAQKRDRPIGLRLTVEAAQ